MQSILSSTREKGSVVGFPASKNGFAPFFQPFVEPYQLNDPYRSPNDQEAKATEKKAIYATVNGSIRNSFFKPAVPGILRKYAYCKKNPSPLRIQRTCSACDDEEIHRMAEEEEELAVQRKPGDAGHVDSQLEQKLCGPGGGEPLPGPIRSFFEPRFGHSFNDVRVHKGAAANQTAKAINAKAYTVGNHIAFAGGQYDFNSDSGRRLMAHELTHTLQQSAGATSVQRGSAGIFGGKGCLRAPRIEWALVGAGVWKKLEQDQCTGTMEDADGMTCGGGFYRLDNGQRGNCSDPRNDDATFAPRRWTPSSAGANATSPTTEGSQGGDTPPTYAYD
jgi:hypothetical protein